MLKAIETSYDGYRFRSRLEARWAVFFNALGVPYEYEKEGFDLGEAGLYLPDFWLPRQSIWVEIKPVAPNDAEGARAEALARQSGHSVFICYGDMPLESMRDDSAHVWFADGSWDNCYEWLSCPRCGTRAMIYSGAGNPDRLCDCPDNLDYVSAVTRAYGAARSARFEHGESGRVIVNGRVR